MSWFDRTTEAIYVFRARKPHALLGLPIIGRHFAYVGRTNNLRRRYEQHMIGGGEYRSVAKDWADLEPRFYVICPMKSRMEITTHFLEWFWIKVLMPVYNIQMNRTNPRRIKPWVAKRQRINRNRYGRTTSVMLTLIKVAVLIPAVLVAFNMAESMR
jgi:hypothetical protein